MSVDTLHTRTHELSDFGVSKRLSSHKFLKKAALSYEVALSLWTNKIVHVNRPFPAAVNDLTIYRMKLKNMIPVGKKVIANMGYAAESGPEGTVSVRNSLDSPEVREFKKRARARQETFNAAIKRFECMRYWRHDLNRHKIAFYSIVVMLQYNLDCGDELFHLLED